MTKLLKQNQAEDTLSLIRNLTNVNVSTKERQTDSDKNSKDPHPFFRQSNPHNPTKGTSNK